HIHTDYTRLTSDEVTASWANHPTLRSNPTQIPTDDKGRFQLDGLIPGWLYNAYATAPRTIGGQKNISYVIGAVLKDVRIEPGEKRDLGDVRVPPEKDDQQEKAKPVENPAAARRQPAGGTATRTVAGVVLTPDGKPAAGATVRAAA